MLISVYIYVVIKLYLILNIYQQSHYQFLFYLKHFLYNFLFYNLFPLIILIVGLYNDYSIILIICSIYLDLFSLCYLFSRVKLKLTKRIIRIFVLAILFTGIGLIPIVGPYLLLFYEFFIIPILGLERIVAYFLNRRYIVKATAKVKDYRNNIIAITGSFGKTSTKMLLNQGLNLFYKSKCTDKSYNTELGISIFINNLTDLSFYDYLVFEFGASHKNDIKKLKKIANPDVVFVTGIGYMHVETFKNIDNIIREKMSITENAKIAVLNYDCEYIRTYPVSKSVKIISYGFEHGNYQAKNVNSGFDFYHLNKFICHFDTNLTGTHQILNLLGVVSYLYNLNVDLEVLKKGVLTFKSEKSRLELKKYNDMYILDDSFNSNYKGFIEALNVLKNHTKKRILLTPGMVELGKYKKELLTNLVAYIVSSCDVVILIGYYQTKYLYSLLKDYRLEVYLVRNFMEGYRLFLTIAKEEKDCMLLIENDLPDVYRVGLL